VADEDDRHAQLEKTATRRSLVTKRIFWPALSGPSHLRTVTNATIIRQLVATLHETTPKCRNRCFSPNTGVVDDGVGFAVPDRLVELVKEGHLGPACLHERVQHAGGCLRVTSVPGEGTVVQVVG